MELVDAVKELLENGARLLEGVAVGRELLGDAGEEGLLSGGVVPSALDELDAVAAEMSRAVGETMAVGDPILLD